MHAEVNNEADLTAFVARDLVPALLAVRAPRYLLLQGPLGAGKTTLAKALVRALADDPALDVPSPTYTLLQSYDTPHGLVQHFDLYRLHHQDEVVELGWDETAQNALTIVEWPERLGYLTPKKPITLAIAPIPLSDTARSITIAGL
jgi:tRNA threonylcarbamoyladenosine biosynthesis protein TsaE